RALSDAYVTAQLFIELKNKLENLPYETLKQLKKLEHNFSSDLTDLLNVMVEDNVFKQYPNYLNIYQGLAVSQLEVKEQVTSIDEQPTFTEFLNQMYSGTDGLKKYLPNYVYRKEQKQMSQLIYDSFQQGQ